MERKARRRGVTDGPRVNGWLTAREFVGGRLIPQLPSDAKSKRLYRIFNCAIKCEVIKASVMDLGKLVAGSAHQLENLQQVCDVINTNQLEKLYIEVESNTKVLVDAGAALERSGAALSVFSPLPPLSSARASELYAALRRCDLAP